MDAETRERLERLERLEAGELRRGASVGVAGLLSATDKATLDALGSVQEDVRGANIAVPATTVTIVAGTITLPPGTWAVWGWANLLMGAGAGTADLYVRDAATVQLPGSLATFALAAGAQGGGGTPVCKVDVATTTTYTLACYATAACTARASGGAGGFNNTLGLRAIRVG